MVTTVDVKDAAGTTRNVPVLPVLGQATKAGSLPVALASDNDIASQTTLAALLAKIIAAPATEATLATIAASLSDTSTPVPVTPAAGELHLGEVGSPISFVDVTLVTDTSAYASGDVMVVAQVVTNAVRVNDGKAILQSVQLLDVDAQGIGLDLLFFDNTTPALGAINGAVAISDANAASILGAVSFAAADYISLGGSKMATKPGNGLGIKPVAGTRNVYIGAIARGVGTFSAAGLKVRLTFLEG